MKEVKMKKIRVMGGVLVASILALVTIIGCAAPGAAPPVTKAPIPVGVVATQTGPAKPIGFQIFYGARVAAKEINDAGGLLDGRMIELIELPEGYSAEVSAESTEEAIARGATLILGTMQAGDAYACMRVVKKYHKIYYDAIAGTDMATVPGYYRGIFNSPIQTKQSCLPMCYWLNKMGYKKLALLPWQADYGMTEDAWLHWYVDNYHPSFELCDSIYFGMEQTDITAEVTAAAEAGADVIWPDMYSLAGTGPAIERLNELGWEGLFVDDWTSLDNGVICREGGELVNGVVSYTGWRPDPEIPESMVFANKYWDYLESIGVEEDPGDYSVSAYIGLMAYAKAVEEVGFVGDTDAEVDAIIDAMYHLENWITPRGIQHEILPGGLEFNPGVYILECRDGETVVIDYQPLTREDFGPPYVPPGWKTLLELEEEAGR